MKPDATVIATSALKMPAEKDKKLGRCNPMASERVALCELLNINVSFKYR